MNRKGIIPPFDGFAGFIDANRAHVEELQRATVGCLKTIDGLVRNGIDIVDDEAREVRNRVVVVVGKNNILPTAFCPESSTFQIIDVFIVIEVTTE